MIGLPVNLRGLDFSDIRASKNVHDGVTVLIIEGTIENATASAVSVPRLRFALRNAAMAELLSWTAPPEQGTLGPGEALPFRSRLSIGFSLSWGSLQKLPRRPSVLRSS